MRNAIEWEGSTESGGCQTATAGRGFLMRFSDAVFGCGLAGAKSRWSMRSFAPPEKRLLPNGDGWMRFPNAVWLAR